MTTKKMPLNLLPNNGNDKKIKNMNNKQKNSNLKKGTKNNAR